MARGRGGKAAHGPDHREGRREGGRATRSSCCLFAIIPCGGKGRAGTLCPLQPCWRLSHPLSSPHWCLCRAGAAGAVPELAAVLRADSGRGPARVPRCLRTPGPDGHPRRRAVTGSLGPAALPRYCLPFPIPAPARTSTCDCPEEMQCQKSGENLQAFLLLFLPRGRFQGKTQLNPALDLQGSGERRR